MSGKLLKFHGECIANSDEYYSVSINTIQDQKAFAMALYAKSDTDYYLLWKFNVIDTDAIPIAAKLHFDPDTSNCATQAYSTQLKITYKVIDNVCLFDGNC